LVLDASVAVAAARPGEPSHATARARISRVLGGEDDAVVPALFAVEVVSALARANVPLPAVRGYVDALLVRAAAVVPLGARAARRVGETAMRWQLRASDAVYVWLAARDHIPLCTLDQEMARRGRAACEVIAP
jgi:predicted nucleic acid-binding protein